MKKKTRVIKATGGQCQWAETFHFHLASLDEPCSLSVRLYSRSSVRRKQCLGQVCSSRDCTWTKPLIVLSTLEDGILVGEVLKCCIPQVYLGFDSSVSEAVELWKDMMAHPEKVVAAWHSLSPAWTSTPETLAFVRTHSVMPSCAHVSLVTVLTLMEQTMNFKRPGPAADHRGAAGGQWWFVIMGSWTKCRYWKHL